MIQDGKAVGGVKAKFTGMVRTPVLILALLAASCSYVSGQTARITQVDRGKFPDITVWVSVTDKQGNAVFTDKNVELTLLEDAVPVAKASASKHYSVSTVLVLDISGSMSGEKLRQAKAAAINYVNQSGSNHQIALVSFSTLVHVLSDFTTDKARLQARIQGLSVAGKTALQDATERGLDLLGKRSDRRSMLILTDGYENGSRGSYAGDSGKRLLIQRAIREDVSISTIGLGDRSGVDEEFLRSFEETRGKYFHSPDPSQLSSIFEQSLVQLQKEYIFTYTTKKADPDGTRRSLTVTLGGGPIGAPTFITAPGLLPHVEGDHTVYLIVLLLMLAIPVSVVFMRSFISVYRFRKAHMVKIRPGSPYIGQMDPNDGPAERFVEGDVLIICPISDTPHHVQCWRLNKCRCFRDSGVRHFCYHRTFPKWLRKSLDYLFAQRRSDTGRTWLCHCAGDQKGY